MEFDKIITNIMKRENNLVCFLFVDSGLAKKYFLNRQNKIKRVQLLRNRNYVFKLIFG